MTEQIIIDAYAMVPISIRIDVTSGRPTDCKQFASWFEHQLEIGVANIANAQIKVENSFVDVCGFSIGDDYSRSMLSQYYQKELFNRLKAIAEEGLQSIQKIKDLL